MGFYRDVILPKLCDCAMRNERLAPWRARVIGAAEGRVLEIGAGSGLNIPLYGAGVSEVLALEPEEKLRRMAAEKQAPRPVKFIEASAEQIPLDDASVDTVVTTWTLCSIPDGTSAMYEARGVLKPGGRLLFVEHGLSPDRGVRRWQNGLNPFWRRISGGCNLNRAITEIIASGGFQIDRLDNAYLPGPKFMSFLYEGSARPQ